jgi:hypothetical protein
MSEHRGTTGPVAHRPIWLIYLCSSVGVPFQRRNREIQPPGGLPTASLPTAATAADTARADAAIALSTGATRLTATVVPTSTESPARAPVTRRSIAIGAASATMMPASDGARGRSVLRAGAAMRRSAFASTANANVVARKDEPAGIPARRRSSSFSRRYTRYASPKWLAPRLLPRFCLRAVTVPGDSRARYMGSPDEGWRCPSKLRHDTQGAITRSGCRAIRQTEGSKRRRGHRDAAQAPPPRFHPIWPMPGWHLRAEVGTFNGSVGAR